MPNDHPGPLSDLLDPGSRLELPPRHADPADAARTSTGGVGADPGLARTRGGLAFSPPVLPG